LVAEKILTEASQVHEGADNEERHAEDARCFIKTSVVQTTFLCGVLCQDSRKHHLAFRIGLHGLEVLRRPARSKALEVSGDRELYSIQ
jgi:hypothetical protein